MKKWKLFQVILYRLGGIPLIFLVTTGSCMQSSLSENEVGRTESYFESKDRKISTLSNYEKYIMKPYFEKYDSLQDLHFKTFMDHELYVEPGIPDLVLILEQSLIGQGSHRRLSLTIKISISSEFLSKPPKHFCEIIYIGKLPSGVFADSFELQHLVQRGVFTDAVVFGDTNLELPSFLSNRSLVEIHMDIGLIVLSRLSKGVSINIELPLHARYQPLVDSGYSQVEVPTPEFFMRCGPEKSHPQSCLQLMKVVNAKARSSDIWSIPSGIESHAQLVSVVTFTFAISSALLIVMSSICSDDVKLFTKSKQC